MPKNFSIKIKRYDPGTGKIWFETHKVPADPKLTILDAVRAINEGKQASVSHRSSCQMGICGSCGAIVNGKPVLMCSTFCKDLKTPITIEPLKNFPIVKDLVVDTDNAMDKMREALPYTTYATSKSKSASKQTPRQLNRIKETSQCIKCMLCYSACPIFGLDKEFIGPAAIATGWRYNKDTRDKITNKRMDSLTSKDGVWKCSFIGECSNVCPKSVDPAGAIQKMKVMGVLHSAKSIVKRKKK